METMLTKKDANDIANAERNRRLERAYQIISKGIQTSAREGQFMYYVPKRAVQHLDQDEVEIVRKWLAGYGYEMNEVGWGNAFEVFWD